MSYTHNQPFYSSQDQTWNQSPPQQPAWNQSPPQQTAWPQSPPYIESPDQIYQSQPRGPTPQGTIFKPPQIPEVRWGIHSYTPVMMVLLFILGAGSAAGHHLYYSKMHGTAAGDANRQQWVNQIGTGLAFLSNAALASVVGISRTQWVWATLRRRFITVAGIDALFGVTLDPTYFMNLDMIRRAKLATFMAVLIWIFPITAILTPGAISVHTVSEISTVPCNVRTLAFEFDTKSTAQKLCCDSSSSANTTGAGIYVGRLPGVPSFVSRVFTLAALSGNIQIPGNVGQYSADPTTLAQDCGLNCTYTVTFLGPGIQCIENTDWSASDLSFPSAEAFMGETYFRAELGKNEVLWAGYSAQGGNSDPHVLFCQRSVVRYRVGFEVLNSQFREPTIEAVETLYIIPDTSPQYPDTTYLPNFSVLTIVWTVIHGNLSTHQSFRASDIVLTPLYADINDHPSRLGPNIERMAQVMVASLLSIDTPGTDARHPLLEQAALETNDCTTTKYATLYNYKPQRLFFVYGASACVSLFMALVGFVALARNGVSSSVSFSAILRTTRNPTLDRLVRGFCLGADPMPEELGALRLKFGEVRTQQEIPTTVGPDGIGHVTLGIEGEVFPIRNGARYS